MSDNLAVVLLESLRSSGETELREESVLAVEQWRSALEGAAPLPAIRQIKLSVNAWDAGLLAALARVCPGAEALDFSQTSAAQGDPASLDDLLSAFWHHPLRALSVVGLRRWTKPLPPSLPAFGATLESLALPAAKAAGLGAFLAEKSPFPRLTTLAVGVVDSVEAIARACPALVSLSVYVDPRYTPRLALTSRALEHLTLGLVKRPADISLALSGALPGLKSLELRHQGAAQVDPASLAALLATARPSLASIDLYGAPGWPLAAAAGRELAALPGPRLPRIKVDLSSQERAPADLAAERWQQLEGLLRLGFAIDPVSMIEICDRAAFFRALVPHLPPALTSLELNEEHHQFLLEEPELLAPLVRLERLTFFGADALTSERLERLLAALPGLDSLKLINNHNPACRRLVVRSESLRSLALTHFHSLETFAFDTPRLEQLEFDNCDGGIVGLLAQRPEVGDGVVYGNFPLRFLAALLDGDPAAQAPALRELVIWHNPYGMGIMLAFEHLRMEVACRVGHPRLELLTCHNTPHLRRLTLRHLPALQSVHVGQMIDEGPGTTWLEEVTLEGLPAGCEVDLCSLSPGRKGLAL